MGTWLTRALVGGLVALTLAAMITALRRDYGGDGLGRPAATVPRAAATPASPAGCTRAQLSLAIEVLGGSATVVLRHVRGARCRLARVPVRVTVTDPAGRDVGLQPAGERRIGGDFGPGFERLLDITYLPSCARGPYSTRASAGPYSATRLLSTAQIGCHRGG